jgi:hypothetical protein
MKTILWLGAHKTGTTFLQKSLDLSQPALRAAGIFYMELDEFREKYGRPLLNAQADPPAPNEFTPEWASTTLVFDENIPGYVQHALSQRGFYPDMIARSTTITDYLGLVPDEVVFGVRNYGGYLPSLYCETLKSTPFKTFDAYLARAFRSGGRRPSRTRPVDELDGFDRMNWAALVHRLVEHYPSARVRVYFYEHLRGREAQLLSKVLGLPEERVTLLTTLERVGFSDEAVRQLHLLDEERKVTVADVRRTVRTYPTGPDQPTFSPFEDAEKAWLTKNYEEHAEELRSDTRVEIIDFE